MSTDGVLVQTKPDPTVVVADYSTMDCQLLAETVQRRNHLRVIGSATTSDEVVSEIGRLHPDVALISARLRDGAFAGLLALQQLRLMNLRTRSIVLLDDNQPELIVEAFRYCARGVFCRNGAVNELRKCIQVVHNG